MILPLCFCLPLRMKEVALIPSRAFPFRVIDWNLPEAVVEVLTKTTHRLRVIALDVDIGYCLQS